MACNHKFQNELNLEGLDYEPTTLIVGTFNPEWPEGNYAEWFYGRTDNNYFWDLLPRMFGDKGLRSRTQTEWKKYCRKKKVAITDLLSVIKDADPRNDAHRKILGKYTDTGLASKFKGQKENPIIPLIEANRSITAVYLTTTIKSGFWQKLWNPIEEYCSVHKIPCKKLKSPSKGARFSMTKNSGISLPDFIYSDWITKWKHHG